MELSAATLLTMLVVCILLTLAVAICLCLLFCRQSPLQFRKEEVPVSVTTSCSTGSAESSVRLLGINAPLTPTPSPPRPDAASARRVTRTPWKLRLLSSFPAISPVSHKTSALEEVLVVHTRAQNLHLEQISFKDTVVRAQDGATECTATDRHCRPDFSRMFGAASHSIPSLIFDPSGLTMNQSVPETHRPPVASGERSPSVLSSFLPYWSTTVLSSTSVVVSSTPVKV